MLNHLRTVATLSLCGFVTLLGRTTYFTTLGQQEFNTSDYVIISDWVVHFLFRFWYEGGASYKQATVLLQAHSYVCITFELVQMLLWYALNLRANDM